MSNLKIAPASIPFEASRIIAGNTTDDIQNHYNWTCGPRYHLGKFAAAAASNSVTFDLGSGYTSKNSTCEFLAIARADLLACNTVLVESSPDNSAWTTRFNITSFTGTTRYGPRSHDYISTITATSQIRYWKVTYSMSAGTNTFVHSKTNIGSFINFTYDPDFNHIRVPASQAIWKSSAGTTHTVRTGEPVYRFKFEWPGQTSAIYQAFQNRIVRYADKAPVWLYTSAEHQILDNQQLVYAKLIPGTFEALEEKNGAYTIRAEFEELIG